MYRVYKWLRMLQDIIYIVIKLWILCVLYEFIIIKINYIIDILYFRFKKFKSF